MKIKESPGERLFNLVIILILTIICILVVYPLLYVISGSFSDPIALMRGEVQLFPVDFTLEMYRMVFRNPEIWPSYGNTIYYTVFGTLINLFFTICAAYPLSRPDMFGRNVFTAVFVFTMFFSGGMIPSYLLVRDLHMLNTVWALVLPGAISTYNMIVMRTFFQTTIPGELVESAQLDGYNDIQIFWRIVLPLSKPILAVMALFYSVGHWNSWFSALLYISDRSKYPLQMILREILIQSNTSEMAGGNISDQEIVGEGIKYATMVVATLPIMCFYPFLQKYFVKGVMIGAIKG